MRIAVVGRSALGTALLQRLETGTCWDAHEVPGGWRAAASPAEAAARADYAVVGSDETVLLFGRGVARGLPPGACVILAGEADARALAERLGDEGVGVLEARCVPNAVLVAGDRDAFDEAKSVLRAVGKPMFVGPVGAAAAVAGLVADAMDLDARFTWAVERGAFPAQIRNALREAGAHETTVAHAAALAARYAV